MYVEHNKPNWDKLQAVSVLTSDSPKLGPALKKNPTTKLFLLIPIIKKNIRNYGIGSGFVGTQIVKYSIVGHERDQFCQEAVYFGNGSRSKLYF